MKKRVMAAILALSVAVSLVSCGETADNSIGSLEKTDDSTMTRGEWVAVLAEAFGFDTYETDTPIYSDILSSNALYSAVQSAAEWGVLSAFDGNQFDPDKKVTREEVARTAAFATGFQESESMTAVDFAVEQGIIAGDRELSNLATPEECTTAVNAAKTAYLNMEIEEVIIVEPSDKFIDLGSIPADRLKIDGEEIIIFGDSYVTPDNGPHYAVINGESFPIKGDSVYVLPPSEKHPFGIARKISDSSLPVQEEMRDKLGLTYKTKTPSLSDLYNELVVHTTTTAELDRIIWEDGISISPAAPNNLSATNGGEYRAMLLSSRNETPRAVILGQENYTYNKSYDFTFASGEYQKTWQGRNSTVLGDTPGTQVLNESNFVYDKTPSVDDFHGSTDPWTDKLEMENKFSGGYKIMGNITINAITVRTDIEYHKFDLLGNEIEAPFPESASLQITSDIATSLELEGNMKERLKIATVPVPIAATGLTVLVDLYLYADASGALQVGADFGSNARVEWKSPARLKRSVESYMEANAEAALNVDFGADLSASLDALGSVKIMDMGIKVGGELTADAYVGGKCEVEETDEYTTMIYTESMNIKASLFTPVASIYVGGSESLIEQAGISGTWDIMSKDKGAKKYDLVNEEWVFWTKTVKMDKDGNVIFEEETPLGTGEGGPLEGDFSEFAGVYRADVEQMYSLEEIENYGGEYPDIVLHEDGTITGGTTFFESFDPYPEVAPYSVEEYEGGFICHLVEGRAVFNESGEPIERGHEIEYWILPIGVPPFWGGAQGDGDISRVRLFYIDKYGGVFEAYYTKAN